MLGESHKKHVMLPILVWLARCPAGTMKNEKR